MQTWRHPIIMVLGLQTFYMVNTYSDIYFKIIIPSSSICMITLLHAWIKLAAAYDTRTHNNDWSYQMWIKAVVLIYNKAQAASSTLTWIINNYINMLLVADVVAIRLMMTLTPCRHMTINYVWQYWNIMQYNIPTIPAALVVEVVAAVMAVILCTVVVVGWSICT